MSSDLQGYATLPSPDDKGWVEVTLDSFPLTGPGFTKVWELFFGEGNVPKQYTLYDGMLAVISTTAAIVAVGNPEGRLVSLPVLALVTFKGAQRGNIEVVAVVPAMAVATVTNPKAAAQAVAYVASTAASTASEVIKTGVTAGGALVAGSGAVAAVAIASASKKRKRNGD